MNLRFAAGLSKDREYSWSLHVNTPATPGLRARIAQALRSLADALDPCIGLRLRIETSPELSVGQKVECIKRGLDGMRAALSDVVRLECIEQGMREERPELFDLAGGRK